MTSDDRPSRFRWVGCLLQALAAGVVLSVLGCAGAVGTTWWAFFHGIGAPPPAPDRPVVLRGGTLYDGTDAPPDTGTVVLIDGDRITCAKRGCGVPTHAALLDGTGLYAMPGIVDLHVHFGAPVGPPPPAPLAIWETMRHRPAVRAALLGAGVTAIRSVGDDAVAVQNQRIWLGDGTISGPALFAVGPVFTAPGGHPAATLERDAPWLIAGSTRQVDDPDQARTRVVELLDQGFDGVKLVYDDGAGSIPKLDAAVMQAIVAEGRARGVWVAAHTGTDQDVRDVLAAGATTVEHGARDGLSAESIAALKAADATYVPTLAVIEALVPDRLEQARADARAAFEAGVRLGVGSDTQGPAMSFGTSTRREIALLIDAGIPPVQALKIATGNGGAALGKPGEFGVIADGARADLALYRTAPWEDPTAEPVVVIHDGRMVVDRR